MNGTNFWQAASTVADEIIIGSVRIPNGAIVTGVRVAVLGAVGGNVSFDAYRVRRDRTTGATSYTQLGTTTTFAHTGSIEVLNQTGAILGASGTMTEEDILQISVAAGTLGAPASHLHFAEIEYTELRATGSN
jgi:hypothetical protein